MTLTVASCYFAASNLTSAEGRVVAPNRYSNYLLALEASEDINSKRYTYVQALASAGAVEVRSDRVSAPTSAGPVRPEDFLLLEGVGYASTEIINA